MADIPKKLSRETLRLLNELAEENHLSVIKRKGLVEHLVRTTQQPKNIEAYGPRQRPFVRRSRTHLDGLTAMRKKEAIVKSGAYERSQIAPPKGRELGDKEKDRLVHRMAFGCDPTNLPSIEELLRQRREEQQRPQDVVITPRTRQDELTREIEERREFLEEMRNLSQSHFRQVEALVRTEIADKEDELERLQLTA